MLLFLWEAPIVRNNFITNKEVYYETVYLYYVIVPVPVFSLFIPPCFVSAETISSDDIVTSPTVSQDDYSISPLHLFAFIYSEDDSFSFYREFIGPCECVPGYLYVKNLNTDEITQLWTEPVSELVDTANYVFFVTHDNKLMQTDYTGTKQSLLYEATHGSLFSIIHYNDAVYFIDGIKIMRYDLSTNRVVTLLEKEDLTSVFPYNGHHLIIEDSNNQQFTFDSTLNKLELINNENDVERLLFSNASITSSATGSDISINAVTDTSENDINFPINNSQYSYPHGSYFTTDGRPCNHSTTGTGVKCKNYKGPQQCMGFAMFASEKFAHLPSTGSFYRPSGDHVTYQYNTEYHKFQSPGAVRTFFLSLTKGAYVRLSKDSKANDTADGGTHSVVYVAVSVSGVTVYDCNRIGNCQVAYQTRDFTTMYNAYKYVYEYVSHHYTGGYQTHSMTHHRIKCANCVGYVLQSHTFTTSSNGNDICSKCGYIKEIILEG